VKKKAQNKKNGKQRRRPTRETPLVTPLYGVDSV
jgi:hypothetical protein